MPGKAQENIRHRSSDREADSPLLICLLGGPRLLKWGENVPLAGKTLALLSLLARRPEGVPREDILEMLSHGDRVLAGKSLNTLIWSLQRRLGDAIDGARPVVHVGGAYRLNLAAGVMVDTARFEALARAGNAHRRVGEFAAAVECYVRAAALYVGDLSTGTEMETDAIIERERLRACFQELLAHVANYQYECGDTLGCVETTQRLLASDPWREDMHRLIMCCYIQHGERSRALHQYRLCKSLLRTEFGAEPEPATTALFERICLAPAGLMPG